MGSELVSPASRFSYTDYFKKQCPFYLSIGMTYDDYWNGDATMTVDYRKAYIISQRRNNDLAWLQGQYVYDALKAVVPALRGLSKEPINPYLEKPYPYTKEDVEEAKKEQMLKQAQRFREYAEARNAERKMREEAKNNADN